MINELNFLYVLSGKANIGEKTEITGHQLISIFQEENIRQLTYAVEKDIVTAEKNPGRRVNRKFTIQNVAEFLVFLNMRKLDISYKFISDTMRKLKNFARQADPNGPEIKEMQVSCCCPGESKEIIVGFSDSDGDVMQIGKKVLPDFPDDDPIFQIPISECLWAISERVEDVFQREEL